LRVVRVDHVAGIRALVQVEAMKCTITDRGPNLWPANCRRAMPEEPPPSRVVLDDRKAGRIGEELRISRGKPVAAQPLVQRASERYHADRGQLAPVLPSER